MSGLTRCGRKTFSAFDDDYGLVPRNVPASSGALTGYPLVAKVENLSWPNSRIVKMSRLQNVDIAPLPESHLSGTL